MANAYESYPATPYEAKWIDTNKELFFRDKVWAVVDANGEPILYAVPKGMRDEYAAVDVAAALNKMFEKSQT